MSTFARLLVVGLLSVLAACGGDARKGAKDNQQTATVIPGGLEAKWQIDLDAVIEARMQREANWIRVDFGEQPYLRRTYLRNDTSVMIVCNERARMLVRFDLGAAAAENAVTDIVLINEYVEPNPDAGVNRISWRSPAGEELRERLCAHVREQLDLILFAPPAPAASAPAP